MAPCTPTDNSLRPGGKPPFSIPGFGLSQAPIQLPYPDVALPDGVPEDLLELANTLGLLFPSSLFKPNIDNFSKNVLDAVSSLLNQVAPFLSLYNFFMAALNMVVCILDVLCALLNPFKLRRAIKRLFKNCLPAFLSIFPWFALIAQIIALMLLLLALIEYLINTIVAFIEEIRRNLQLLEDAVTLNDAERSLAAARKIASLLCLIQNLFAILIAFGAILAVIEALARIGGRVPCNSNSGSDCCDDDVCPPFIRQNPDGLTGTIGQLIYFKQLTLDSSTLFPGIATGVLPTQVVRNESWQFVDPSQTVFKFSDIITPINGNTYWPDGLSFDANSSFKKVPYFVDIRFSYNPNDGHGQRYFRINDCIVTEKPFIGIFTFDNNFNSVPNTGTFHLTGGSVFEDDNTTPYIIDGRQASLTTFIHQPSSFAPSTGPIVIDDTVTLTNISYTLKYNYEALFSYALITLGCLPDVSGERGVISVQFGDVRSVISKISLPNVSGTSGAIQCLQNALTKFRQNVSLDGADIFQGEINACLGQLQSDTSKAYKDAVGSAFDQFNSTVTLDPTIQFVGSGINVSVTLKDVTNNPIAFNMPQEFTEEFANRIAATPTVGQISQFSFDGKQSFNAVITSDSPGDGNLTVSFDQKLFSLIQNREQVDTPTSIVTNVLTYKFIGNLVQSDQEPVPRRDETDVALDGDNNG